MGPYEIIKAARQEMQTKLLERDEEIDLALTALLAQNHLLLIGAPGTAKSMLLNSLLQLCEGNRFSILLTKFTTPEEVFGHYDLAKLMEGEFLRNTKGKMAEAEWAFLDEIWKASSAILNSMLMILNEGRFDRGNGELVRVPLKLVIAASNEWPTEQKELAALFDRFLIRKLVRPIGSQGNRQKLLWSPSLEPDFPCVLSREDLKTARKEAAAVPFSKEAKDCYETILSTLRREGIQPGDRRVRRSTDVARAYSWLQGEPYEVLPEHLEVLQHVLWDEPEEQRPKAAQVIMKLANPSGAKVAELLIEGEQIADTVDRASLASLVGSANKLQEIAKKLAELKESPRRDKALEHVKGKVSEIRAMTLDVGV